MGTACRDTYDLRLSLFSSLYHPRPRHRDPAVRASVPSHPTLAGGGTRYHSDLCRRPRSSAVFLRPPGPFHEPSPPVSRVSGPFSSSPGSGTQGLASGGPGPPFGGVGPASCAGVRGGQERGETRGGSGGAPAVPGPRPRADGRRSGLRVPPPCARAPRGEALDRAKGGGSSRAPDWDCRGAGGRVRGRAPGDRADRAQRRAPRA